MGAAAAPVEVQANAFAPSGTRTTFSVSYAIKNTASQTQTLTPRLILPEGWRVLLPPSDVTLTSGQETSGIAIVVPPVRTRAGPYPVTLTVGESVTRLTLDMPAQPGVTAQLAEAPTFVVGVPYVATFRVSNTGNTVQNLRFTAFATQGFEVTLDPPRATLTPGQQTDVRVRVSVPARFAHAVKNLLVFQVRGDSELTSSASTEALPGELPLSETYITLPLTVRAGVEVRQGKAAIDAGVAGGTTFADGSSVAFDVNTKAPVAQYRRGRVRVELGYDSPATGPSGGGGGSTTGEGGGVSRSSSPAGTGASVKTSVPGAQVTPTLGVPGFRVAYDTSRLGVEAGVVLTGPGGSGLPISQVRGGRLGFTASARGMPLPSLTLSGYGLVLEDRREWNTKVYWTTFVQNAAQTGQRPARSGEVTAEAQGNFGGKLGVRVTGVVSAPHHYGLVRYSAMRDAAESAQEVFGSYTFSHSAFSMNVNAAYGSQLLGAEPGFVLGGAVARSFSTFSLALGHTYRSSPSMSGVRHETRFSVLSTSPFFSQQMLTWRTDPGNILTYEGSASILTAFGDFKPGLNLTRDFQKNTLVVGGALDYTKAVNRQLSVGLGIKKDNFSRGPWIIEGSGRYLLHNGSAITATGGVQLGGDHNRAAHVRIGYELPLDIPLSPRTDIGRVGGRLVDEDGRPVAGLLVRLGPLKSTTDANGRYSFPSVPEGVYYLDVDAGQIGAARVATPSLPERFEIKRTDNLSRDYTLVRAARVSGQVTVMPESNALTNSSVATRVEDTGALTAGLLVELRSETGTLYRTLTDGTGHFAFDGLLPGSWSLNIAPGASGKDSPRYNGFTLNVVGGVFQLRAGDVGQAEVRVTPVTRNLKIMNGGDLDVSEAPIVPTPSVPGSRVTPPPPTPVEVPRKP